MIHVCDDGNVPDLHLSSGDGSDGRAQNKGHRIPGAVTPGMSAPGTGKGNASAPERARQDLLDSPAEAMVFLRDVAAGFSRGEFVLVLIAFVGILSMLLVVTASVAYLALPRGRLCPHCGGATNPVVLRRLLRILSPWVQWRWCSRCGWEGPGRRGPDLGPLDPPADHDSGFRWGDPDVEEVPIFYWRPDDPSDGGRARPHHLPGFKWQAEKEPSEPTPSEPTEPEPGLGIRRGPRSGGERQPPPPRPWYLSWLVSKNPPGFEWRERED